MTRTLYTLLALALLLFGLIVAGPIVIGYRGETQATIHDIMTHWPQLQAAPSLRGIRGELGGMPLPDGFSLERLPKAGAVWPCNGQEEAVQVCYLNADFSQPANNVAIDFSHDYDGKFIFLMRKGATE